MYFGELQLLYHMGPVCNLLRTICDQFLVTENNAFSWTLASRTKKKRQVVHLNFTLLHVHPEAVYTLGGYSLGARILDLETHALDCWQSTLWEATVSGHRFWIWRLTCFQRTLQCKRCLGNS